MTREEAIDILIREKDEDPFMRTEYRNKIHEALNMAIKALEQEPTKIGHWIYKNYNWYCSECDETPKTLGYVGDADFMREHFKFCNHCGAKMSEITTGSESEG